MLIHLNKIKNNRAYFLKFLSISATQPNSNLTNQENSTSHQARNNLPDRIWKVSLNDIRTENGEVKINQSKQLDYKVNRLHKFNTLPVYTKNRPQLKQIWTLIKKIDGNIIELKNDLLLDFPNSRPILKNFNKPNQTILMRGQLSKEVKLWLQDRGF
ncbi:hypothetical protein O181_096249 [Austropuccinia psidii MF-1]|uniref:Large ribosomal subunit protein mL49 n=1 Tax=Austropuccinia psidii MF-1 TaxID=1389203 RepID=A0A9Q3PCH7_9BASI|nr:hypothetical protein [Austropuccinia psidii MF-1]